MSNPVQSGATLSPELIDQFAPLHQQVEAFRPIQNEHDRLWKKIKPHSDAAPANKPLTLKGTRFEVVLTERATKRSVKESALERLKKVFGAKRFWGIVAGVFPVTPVDAMFDEEQARNFLEESQTGSRRITAVVEIPAAATKAA